MRPVLAALLGQGLRMMVHGTGKATAWLGGGKGAGGSITATLLVHQQLVPAYATRDLVMLHPRHAGTLPATRPCGARLCTKNESTDGAPSCNVLALASLLETSVRSPSCTRTSSASVHTTVRHVITVPCRVPCGTVLLQHTYDWPLQGGQTDNDHAASGQSPDEWVTRTAPQRSCAAKTILQSA